MQVNKKFVVSWTAGAALLLLFFYAATAGLWSAARASAAGSLEKQVSAVLAADLAEGNLFKLGASLTRLMHAGSLEYAEIRAYSPGTGWERIFRTNSAFAGSDAGFAGFSCGSRSQTGGAASSGITLLTTLESRVEGAECVGLLVRSDLPRDLRAFRNKLLAAFGVLLFAVALFFMWLTMAWHRKALALEVAARTAQAEKEAEIGRLAAQVAHDIRSPLVALDSALGHSSAMPEEQRVLVRHAVNRIRDIASNLLDRYRGGENAGGPPEACLLTSLVEPVVAEKRLQYAGRGVVFEFEPGADTYGLFAAVSPAEFRRLLSNLLNNSAEAMGGGGTACVSVEGRGDCVAVRVKDDGKGIPPELLPGLGRRGFTHGKPGGSGLGLYHARAAAEEWGGALDITSEPGKGTEVTVSLPLSRPPGWFVPALAVRPGSVVAVLDDDETVRQVWRGRFNAARLAAELVSFASPEKFREWMKANPGGAALYLLDYELLGSAETGLSLARELKLGNAVLVTSRCEEKAVVSECLRLGIGLIPKALAGVVPLRAAPEGAARAVLIDDDPLVRMNWKAAARAAGVELRVFATAAEFEAAGDAPRDAAIYIDSELGAGIKGEEVAIRLRERGYADLALETGHPASAFAHMPWLRVAGKEPPWR